MAYGESNGDTIDERPRSWSQCVWGPLSQKWLEILTWLQQSICRKWYLGYLAVTWLVTSLTGKVNFLTSIWLVPVISKTAGDECSVMTSREPKGQGHPYIILMDISRRILEIALDRLCVLWTLSILVVPISVWCVNYVSFASWRRFSRFVIFSASASYQSRRSYWSQMLKLLDDAWVLCPLLRVIDECAFNHHDTDL